MCLLGFLKGMRIEDNDPLDITLRTTRTNSILGSLLAVTGVCLAGRAIIATATGGISILGCLGLAAAAVMFTVGLLLMSYRKCVIFCRSQSRIDYMEYGPLCRKRATFHFCDLRQLEICRVAECVAFSPVCMWTVKGYVRRGGGLEAVRLFESTRADGAAEVAHLLSSLLNVRIVQEHEVPFERSFTYQERL